MPLKGLAGLPSPSQVLAVVLVGSGWSVVSGDLARGEPLGLAGVGDFTLRGREDRAHFANLDALREGLEGLTQLRNALATEGGDGAVLHDGPVNRADDSGRGLEKGFVLVLLSFH